MRWELASSYTSIHLLLLLLVFTFWFGFGGRGSKKLITSYNKWLITEGPEMDSKVLKTTQIL